MALRMKWIAWVVAVLVLVNMADGMKRILGKNKSSKELCVSKSWNIYSFKRGQFKHPQSPTEALESLNLSGTAVVSAAIGKEVKCNDAYYMLSYLHLSNPQCFWYPKHVETLHKEINKNYPDWTKKMLVTAFNVAQNDGEMDVAWLLYLYNKRMELHVLTVKDPSTVLLPIMQKAHYGMYKVLLCTMYENDCTMFDPATKEERKFPAYVGVMKRSKPTLSGFSKNSAAVLKLLQKHWSDLCENSRMGYHLNEAGTSCSVPSVQSVTENHLTLDLLYLNDVFDSAKGTTLLTEFGVFQDGDRLLMYLKERISDVKRGSTSFGQYVLSLADFHGHVQRALKTMMLRIYYDFLDKLNMLNKDHRKGSLEQFLRPYNDWCDFFYLPKVNNGFYMQELLESLINEDRVSERIILGTQLAVIKSLKENDGLSKVHLCNHESFDKINIDKTWIIDTAKEYGIPLDARFRAVKDLPNNHIQTTILCAEVLVEFLKKIFSQINFNAIQSLVKLETSINLKRLQEYEQQYQPNVFSLEDETNSIQVCGTKTIRF